MSSGPAAGKNKPPIRPTQQAVMAELARRAKAQPFRLEDHCFDKQLAFINDPAQFKVACCSRRAGKTVCCVLHLLHTAATRPGANCLYIAPTQGQARNVVWREILSWNHRLHLGGSANRNLMTIEFKNGSCIFVAGAKDANAVERFRGSRWTLVYVDEMQSFGAHVEALVFESILYALADDRGTLCLIGTPGPVPTGLFHDAFMGTTKADGSKQKWSSHKWTVYDNPHMRDIEAQHDAFCELQGITRAHPRFKREGLGEWVKDDDSLVYRYDPTIAGFSDLPNQEVLGHDPGWRYVFGVDLGWRDADAIAVLAFSYTHPNCYLVEEHVAPRQTIDDLANRIEVLIDAYDPISIVADTGGLGKKIIESINDRRGLYMKAATETKGDKAGNIALLNSDMARGRFRVRANSRAAHDMARVQWTHTDDLIRARVIDSGFHSDIMDAVLYGWKECRHFRADAPAADRPKPGTQEWMVAESKRMEDQAIKAAERRVKQMGRWVDRLISSGFDPWKMP